MITSKLTGIFRLFIILSIVAFLCSCSGGGGSSDTPINPEGYNISGTVSINSGGTLSGVTMKLTGKPSDTTTTDVKGQYSFSGLTERFYSVSPSIEGYTFSPVSRLVPIGDANASAIDFTATPTTSPTHSISGKVTKSKDGGLSDVIITLSGAGSGKYLTEEGGSYSFKSLANGTYTVEASIAGYDLAPVSVAVELNGKDLAGNDFTATPKTYSISGTVVDSNAMGLPGVTVTLSGAGSAEASTDSSGNFIFDELKNGSYTVTPSMSGYDFTPPNRLVTIGGADATSIIFTAKQHTPPPCSISGTVIDSNVVGMPGVSVTLSGAGSATVTTDPSGNFIFHDLKNGSYTVTPSMAGYTFIPPDRFITVKGDNATGIIFTAIPIINPPPGPIAVITSPSGNATITKGQSVNFQGSASGGTAPYTYQWNFGGGAASSTVQNPGNIVFNTPGVYAVTFKVTDSKSNASSASCTITVVNCSASAPAKPLGVQAEVGIGKVTISWIPVSGATSYRIYWSTTSGVYSHYIEVAASPCVHTNLESGKMYYYAVKAMDNCGNASAFPDEVSASLRQPIPPTAEAGPDQSIPVDALVTLDGSDSTDPDDGIASYKWSQTGGPAVTLTNANAAVATFTASVTVGSTLTFELTVTDKGGFTSTDTCVIRVLSAPIIELLNSMVSIPGGTFMMGSTVDDYWGWNWPVHEVMLQGFEIGAYEVTQAQYAAVIGNNPSFFQGNDNNPVEEVSWYDARTFCTQLSVMTGRTFTLPSEAQWEYACRAGTTTLYSFGDDDTLLGNYAWYSTNSGNQTHPIGTKLPNNWGLYDMHGNVDELCLDSYHENYTDAPADGSAWDPEISTYRMLRGGSYFRVEWYCQSAHRDIDQPDFRYFTYGFRVVAVR